MRLALLFWLAAGVMASADDASPGLLAEVLRQNVNLRAQPSLSAEVVAQVSAPARLTVKHVQDEWVEIVPPDHADLWVLGDYVQDGVIRCDRRVNVRAGAGINFNIVGQLTDGTPVDVRAKHLDWVSIAPPPETSLWVARSLVELIDPLPPEPEPEPEPAPVPEPVPEAEPVPVPPAAEPEVRPLPPPPVDSAPPAPPADLELNPAMPQGELREYEGILRPRSFFVRAPSRYRLTDTRPATGATYTICYVRGNEPQLQALRNRRLKIIGREYWVMRMDYPVLVPERIILR